MRCAVEYCLWWMISKSESGYYEREGGSVDFSQLLRQSKPPCSSQPSACSNYISNVPFKQSGPGWYFTRIHMTLIHRRCVMVVLVKMRLLDKHWVVPRKAFAGCVGGRSANTWAKLFVQFMRLLLFSYFLLFFYYFYLPWSWGPLSSLGGRFPLFSLLSAQCWGCFLYW
jgi:hypothetical protein